MGFGRYPAVVCPWAENDTLTLYLTRGHAHLPVAEILRLVYIMRLVLEKDPDINPVSSTTLLLAFTTVSAPDLITLLALI